MLPGLLTGKDPAMNRWQEHVCRRLMTVPGVGPVVALTYRATVDVPARFRKSKSDPQGALSPPGLSHLATIRFLTSEICNSEFAGHRRQKASAEAGAS
jgi:hypothetical protein